MSETTGEGCGMPRDIHYAHLFQVFNTVSYSLVLGLPMLLFFKHLDAPATVLGAVSALPALLNVLQIPAARFLEPIGYRAFALRGWTSRSFFIVGMVGCLLLNRFLDAGAQMALMLFFLFGYAALRGISACAFLPWMTHLVPEPVRGTFLSRDQAWAAFAGCLVLLGTAALFRTVHGDAPFAIAFAASFLAAMASLYYLRRIPDVPVAPQSAGGGPLPWRAMLFHPPFLKLLVYNVVVNTALAASTVFWVPVARDLFGWRDSAILLFGAAVSALSIGTLWSFGKMVDRVGSRPMLAFSGLALAARCGLWFCGCSGLLRPGTAVVALLVVLGALADPLFGMANQRLLMGTVPLMGRSHFFALHSVINSITLGLMPILWGLGLDGLKNLHWKLGAGDFNGYSLLYLTLILVIAISLYLLKRLDEPRAMTTEAFFYELLVVTPSRALTRIVGFRRPLL